MKRLDFLGASLLILSLVIGVIGFSNIRSNTEDVLEWLPDSSAAREDLKRFESLFGSDDYLVITWQDCTVDDQRVEVLRQAILDGDQELLVQNVITGPAVLRRLSERNRMSKAEIVRRLQGFFFGFKKPSLTCLNVELSTYGAANRKKAMALVHAAIAQVPNLPADQIVLGGYPFIATTIDRQLMNSLRYSLVPSVILATLVSLLCLRSLALTLIVFATSVGAAIISISVIPLTGTVYGGLMSIIPALVFVLATSGGIHLIRYSLLVGTNPRDLLAIGWVPCTVSAATTIVGMLAMTGSEFPAIRKFGVFCAIGAAVGWIYQLILVPWLLHRIGKRGVAKLAARQAESSWWRRWYEFLVRFKASLALACLLLLLGGAFGLAYLRASVEVENLFRVNSPILESIRKLEEQLGPLDQTELLLVYSNVDRDNFDERVRQVKVIQQAIRNIDEVHFTHSLLNYLPDEPLVSDARSFARRSMYRSRLRSERENMSNRRNLVITDDQEAWRISLRFPFSSQNDWEGLGIKVKQVVEPFLQEFAIQNPDKQAELIYTGRANLFQHAQRNLLQDLFRNFLLAFTVITPMLIIALRSFTIGLLAMLPNLFPAILLFGGLGFVGYPVDLAIAMTACIALGVAVDDTTHFLVRFRESGGSLTNVSVPIQRVIEQCGPAMLHTTLIACGGLLVYVFGEMLVVARFAVTISLLLFFALLADLVMMPSILLILESKFKNLIKNQKYKLKAQANESLLVLQADIGIGSNLKSQSKTAASED